MNFSERVQKYEYKLNDTDDQIIEYISNNKEEVVNSSIQVLAKNNFTVPNSIVRLTKKLDYEGFSHFKMQLKQELENTNDKDETLMNYMKKTADLIDEEQLEKISKVIFRAKKVACFAVGDTAPFGESVSRRFKNMGVNISFYHYRHEIIEEIKTGLGSNDVVILLSISGQTQQVIEVAEIAKEKQLTIVSATHFSKNKLVELADYKVYCYSPKRKIGIHDMEVKSTLIFAIENLSEYYYRYTQRV